MEFCALWVLLLNVFVPCELFSLHTYVSPRVFLPSKSKYNIINVRYKWWVFLIKICFGTNANHRLHPGNNKLVNLLCDILITKNITSSTNQCPIGIWQVEIYLTKVSFLSVTPIGHMFQFIFVDIILFVPNWGLCQFTRHISGSPGIYI